MFPYQDTGDWCSDRCYLVIRLSIAGCLILAGGIACIAIILDDVPYKNMKFYVNRLSVDISVRNSNKMERISYSNIRSNPSCNGKDLGLVSLPSFRQGTKNTTFLHLIFQGQTPLKLRGSHLKDFNFDQRDGSYSISVYLQVKTQLTFAGGGKSLEPRYIVHCGLSKLHLLGSSSSNNQTGIGGLFKTRRCTHYPRGDDDPYY
ncbi:hypothetical protein MKX03_022135 [Papaver bracteatum]|nr:hypothetical protein MKX03_022135 [Papaver bracteatum]